MITIAVQMEYKTPIYICKLFLKGEETLPKLANYSDRETGFTSGTKAQPAFLNRVMSDAYDKASDIPAARLDHVKKTDPAEYLNMTNPNNYSRYFLIKHKFQERFISY